MVLLSAARADEVPSRQQPGYRPMPITQGPPLSDSVWYINPFGSSRREGTPVRRPTLRTKTVTEQIQENLKNIVTNLPIVALQPLAIAPVIADAMSSPSPAPTSNIQSSSSCKFSFWNPFQCLPSFQDAYNYLSGGYDRVKQIVMEEVMRPRKVASEMGNFTLRGDQTKWKCYRAFKDFGVRAKLFCSEPPGVSAYTASAYFESTGLTNMANQIRNLPEEKWPVNTIYVYRDITPGKPASRRHGHIEYKLEPKKYCSDHCSARPISDASHNRELIGAFTPPGCNQ